MGEDILAALFWFYIISSPLCRSGHALKISELFQQQNSFCHCQCTGICHLSEERKWIFGGSEKQNQWIQWPLTLPPKVIRQWGLGSLMVCITSFQPILMTLPGLPEKWLCHWNTVLLPSACKGECTQRAGGTEGLGHFQALQLLGRRVQMWDVRHMDCGWRKASVRT